MKNKGFIATITVIIVCTGVLIYQYVTWSLILSYVDMIDRMALRIEAGIKAESCGHTVAVMLAKDYFLQGDIYVREFDCSAHITRDHATHHAAVSTYARAGHISSSLFETSYIVF
jgi:hypothetical protein